MLLFLIMVFFTSGCTSQQKVTDSDGKDLAFQEEKQTINEKNTSPSNEDQKKDSIVSDETGSKALNNAPDSDDDRYYYNIRIIAPSELDTLKNEIKSDESPIYSEHGDLIGIVSPRKLYIRGDLVELQKTGGKSGKTFDKNDVAEHLIEITFGNDNSKTQLFKSDKDYQFWLDAFYTTDDTKFLLQLAPILNSLSETTQFEDEELALGFLKTNYADVPYNFYNIKIIPENMLDDYKDERKTDERLIKDSNGKLIGMVGSDHLYLLDSLSSEERQYYMLYGILYSMGMHGTTYSEKDSFFYRVGGVQNKELSDLDKEAIKLLYGGRVKSGTDMEETKKTLGLET